MFWCGLAIGVAATFIVIGMLAYLSADDVPFATNYRVDEMKAHILSLESRLNDRVSSAHQEVLRQEIRKSVYEAQESAAQEMRQWLEEARMRR